jgi:hypothetical protein
MVMTNLVLLSISVVTNQMGGQTMMTFPKHCDDPGCLVASIAYKKVPMLSTNYHFGIIQGTNQIELLVLKQP